MIILRIYDSEKTKIFVALNEITSNKLPGIISVEFFLIINKNKPINWNSPTIDI